MTGGGAVIEGGGSISYKGAGGREAMQQPAKQEKLRKRRSQFSGCYMTTNQIRVAQQEAEAQCNLLRGGGAGRLQAGGQKEAEMLLMKWCWQRRPRCRGADRWEAAA